MKLISSKLSKIYFGHNDLTQIKSILEKTDASKVFFAVSKNVSRVCLKKILSQLALPHQLAWISDGESNKNFKTITKILKMLLDTGVDRRGLLISVGGGTLSDCVGFAASIYLRGIRWGCIPTTPISQMDAAIGGKTALDFYGKNTIGSFHLPDFVFIDTSFLNSFSENQIREASSEIAKMALGFDKNFVTFLFENPLSQRKNLNLAVKRSILLKEKVVLKDPLEKNGYRKLLNFGHSFGHVFEMTEKISHGEAIAKGLKTSIALSRKLGFCSEKAHLESLHLLEKLGILKAINMPPQQTLQKLLFQDKKRVNQNIDFIFLAKMGKVIKKSVPVSELVSYANTIS